MTHKGVRQHPISNRYVRWALSYIMSFILFMMFTLLTLIALILSYFFQNKSYLNAMERTGFYSKVLEKFDQDIQDLALPYGYSGSLLTGLVTETTLRDDIRADMQASLDAISSYLPNTTKLEEQLSSRLTEGVQAPAAISAAKEYQALVVQEYRQIVHLPYLSYLGGVRVQAVRYLQGAAIFLMIISIGALFALFLIRGYRYKGFRYLSYALGGCGLFLLLGAIGLLLSGICTKLNLSPDYYRLLVQSFLLRLTVWVLVSGVCFAVLSAVFVWVTSLVRRRELNEN